MKALDVNRWLASKKKEMNKLGNGLLISQIFVCMSEMKNAQTYKNKTQIRQTI